MRRKLLPKFLRPVLPPLLVLTGALGATRASAEEASSFDDALKRMVNPGAEVNQRTARLNAADARIDQNVAAYYPTVSATAGLDRGNTVFSLPLEAKAGFGLSTNLYRFGADQAKTAASVADREALQASLTLETSDRAHDAAVALFTYVNAARGVTLAKHFADIKAESMALAKGLYQRGEKPQEDIDRLSLDYAAEMIAVREAQRDQTSAVAAIYQMAGAPLAVQPYWPWEAFLKSPAALKLADAPAGDTPKLASLAATSTAAEAAIAAARRANGPSLDATLNYDWLAQTAGGGLLHEWSAGLSFSLPLFDGGLTRAQIAEAAAKKHEADARAASEAQSRGAGLNALREAYRAALIILGDRESLVTKSQTVYETSLTSYRRGVLSALDLSADESRLFTAERGAEDALLAAHRATLDLCQALGRPVDGCVTSR